MEPISFPIFPPGQQRAVLSFHHKNNKLLTKIRRKQKPFLSHFSAPGFFLPIISATVSNHHLLPLKPPPLVVSSLPPSPPPHPTSPPQPAPAFPRWQNSRFSPQFSRRSLYCASFFSPRRRPRSPAPLQAISATAARYISC
jgi:hypothetical protein